MYRSDSIWGFFPYSAQKRMPKIKNFKRLLFNVDKRRKLYYYS